jgi:hypothetical protein
MKACLPQDASRTLMNAFLVKTGITEDERNEKDESMQANTFRALTRILV